ncbi:MAG TPA: CARDB domain-containing protein, partial [Candidatus Paceibacterota bacterium]|nr:CARDB domain-containing protein [Candidatus Paceibacterota bacterium]
LGIMLAIYSARYVPAAVSRVGSAAVSLSQIFVPAHTNDTLTVVPQIPFGDATTTATSTATTTTVTSPLLGTPAAATSAGPKTTTSYPAGGVVSNAPLYGQADLAVSITQVGYLTSNSTDSFVSGAIVPSGDNAAVKFSVTNTGTNISGPWSFTANLPTNTSFIFTSNPQQSLRPGERIDFTLGFDRAQSGVRQVTITADSANQVSESNESNNTAVSNITIQ